MIEVESSMIHSAGYDEKEMSMYVRFKTTDDVYKYKEVPSGIFTKFMAAPSKGQFLNQFVVKAGYEYEKIGNAYTQEIPISTNEIVDDFKISAKKMIDAGLARYEMDEQGNMRIVLIGEAVKEALS